MIPLSDLPFIEWVEPSTSEVKRLYADVMLAEGAHLPAIVTKHTVEVGSQITDHYRKEPETVSIRMLFTRNPLRGDLDEDSPGVSKHFPFKFPEYPPGAPIYTPGGAFAAAENGIASLFGGGTSQPSGYDALAFANPPLRFEKSIDLIRRFQTEGILCVFSTTFARFENMGILDAAPSRPEDGSACGIIEFQAEQIRSVSSDVATAGPLPAEPRGQAKGSNSASGGEGVDGEQASVAKASLNSAGVTTAGSGR